MKILIGLVILCVLAYVLERMEYEKETCEYEEEWFVYFFICAALRFCFVMWSVVACKFMGIFE